MPIFKRQSFYIKTYIKICYWAVTSGVVTKRCLALKKEEIVNMTIFAPLVFSYYIILGGQIVNVPKTILEKYLKNSSFLLWNANLPFMFKC